MAAIWKELRPTMADIILSRVDFCDLDGSAASGQDFIERRRKTGGEKNDAVRIPGPATSVRCIADDVRCTAFDIKALQLAVGKETDRTTVGRPEGMAGTFGAGQRFAFAGVEGAQPEADLAVGVVDGSNKVTTVRGNGRDAAFVDFDGSKSGFVWGKDGSPVNNAIPSTRA